MKKAKLHFDVSVGLKRVLGRELITDDEVAIFEMVKNSFDAGASDVQLYFDSERIIVADNGSGMTYDDLTSKWLFVAYSAKRQKNLNADYRDKAAGRGHLAGSKGVGRFSSDRLGNEIVVQTRAKEDRSTIHKLVIDWSDFDDDDRKHFETIPVSYEPIPQFDLPKELSAFAAKMRHGTAIEIRDLRHEWTREALQSLKAALAKLINPFGSTTDRFSIQITAPAELKEDKRRQEQAKKAGLELSARDTINGVVGNFIFSELQEKTTFIEVSIKDGKIESTLTDRGEIIYKIKEPNPYKLLDDADFHCELYYLNHSAKLTFARRIGLPSVQFGSTFLFRNGFRVYPIGEDGEDWFGFNRRKQQGHSRYLGSREVIGRVDIYGTDENFAEASSRNQGLIDTAAVRELQRCVMEHCLKRLEKYVVPVSWADTADADMDDISRLLTDPGRARVAAAVAKLVDNDQVELIDYSRRLIGILNERSEGFEASLVSLRAIAEKTSDKKFLDSLEVAEKRFDELRKSEAEARKVADREREASLRATQRAIRSERLAEEAKAEADIERRRAHFLDALVSLDVSRTLNLHHQVTIYSVDLGQQIENLLHDTKGRATISREEVIKALEQISILNLRIQAATKFATMANFELDSGMIEADLPSFFEDYINKVSVISGTKRTKVQVGNSHPGMTARFNPMDVAIIVENLISNSKRAKASRVTFTISGKDEKTVLISVTDNGEGLSAGADPDALFQMGYTTTTGSGLGLYHVRQVLGDMNGSIEFDREHKGRGATFQIVIASKGKRL
ncbi:ATP-binding protein [Methylocystis sp.]|uniref:ATP-binding protein n=1 Tax=Methylocystis sp. TaxID=1911079 RepID=UPI003DA36C0F